MCTDNRVVKYIRLEDGKVLSLEKNFFALKRSQKEFIGKRFVKYFKSYIERNNELPSREDLKNKIFLCVYHDVETKGIQISKEKLWIYMYQFTHKLLENYYPEFTIGEKELEIIKSYAIVPKS